MSVSSILEFLQVGVAGVFLILFITGQVYPRTYVLDLKAEIAELKARCETERDRADTAVAATKGATDVILAFQAGLRQGLEPEPQPVKPPRKRKVAS